MLPWRENQQSVTDEASDFSRSPAGDGGSIMMGVLGVGLPLIPVGYGIRCLMVGHTYLPGRESAGMDLIGREGVLLAIAYICLGLFTHAHWFWGMTRYQFFSSFLKMISASGFVGCLSFVLYRIWI